MASEINEVRTALERYEEGARVSVAKVAMRTIVAGIPYAGSSILEILDGVALRRNQERLGTVFVKMRERLESIGNEKVDRSFFDSEEFQTLLYLLIEKLHTTHDKEKLQAFGTVLANCGNADFKADDKELHVRTLRDMSLKDLRVLQKLGKFGFSVPITHFHDANAQSSISRLLGLGLVAETLKLREFDPKVRVIPNSRQSSEQAARDVTEAFKRYFRSAQAREYRVSKFGECFLNFIGATESTAERDHETETISSDKDQTP